MCLPKTLMAGTSEATCQHCLASGVLQNQSPTIWFWSGNVMMVSIVFSEQCPQNMPFLKPIHTMAAEFFWPRLLTVLQLCTDTWADLLQNQRNTLSSQPLTTFLPFKLIGFPWSGLTGCVAKKACCHNWFLFVNKVSLCVLSSTPRCLWRCPGICHCPRRPRSLKNRSNKERSCHNVCGIKPMKLSCSLANSCKDKLSDGTFQTLKLSAAPSSISTSMPTTVPAMKGGRANQLSTGDTASSVRFWLSRTRT